MLAASLAVHLALLAAWMSTRPEPALVEPPAVQVQLLRLPPRARHDTRPAPVIPRIALHRAAAEPPPAAAPLVSPIAPPAPASSAAPAAPNPIDPRKLTDQELLEQSGPRPDLAKVFAERAKRPLYSSRLPPGGDDCKPASEHSNRIAPPCPTWGAGPPPRHPTVKLPNRSDVAAEAAYKNAMKTYKEGPMGGPYPGISCAILHSCKP